MGQLEIIDRLCHVNSCLLEIIRKQEEAMAQANIEKGLIDDLKTLKKQTEEEMDIVEFRMRSRK